ncbi:MAG: PHP domain-containing protein [Sedimentisphaerales bacterium]|nr:PHP domain-containing protein [Sedimentisphaerales bacterium]
MRARNADAPGDEDRRQNNVLLMSQARFAVLALLLCMATFVVPAARASDQIVRQEAPFPVIVDPETGGSAEPVCYEVLRGDFHMHTVYSDGTLSPADRVMEAWQYGFDVIAITDHRNFQAYEKALPTAEALDILLLRGMETGLNGQEHLVALDFSADYEPRNPHQWADTTGQATVFYQEQWARLSAADGYVFYAHPHVGLREPMLWGISQGLLGGIAVKNDVVGSGWNTVASHGTYWYPFAFDWAIEHNLTIFANSDVHGARPATDQAVTLVLARDRSREGVMEALRGRRTVAYFNNMLCAHEWVLELLMASLVDVRVTQVEGGRTFLLLQNYGPIELTAQITGTPLGPITLEPYQQILVSVRRKPDTVKINWTNLYIRPTENLTTTHPLGAATAPSPGSR